MKIKEITREELIKAVSEVKSISALLRSFGIIIAGGNYDTIKKRLKFFDINTDHFTGKIHNVGEAFKPIGPKIPLELLLINGIITSSSNLKNRLIKESVKEHRCECCGNDKWLGEKIPIELHHIDGNHYNNTLMNLQILCPNCHSLTDNYKGKNKTVDVSPKTTMELYPELYKKKKPLKNILICEIDEMGIENVSKKYNVTRETVKRWVKTI